MKTKTPITGDYAYQRIQRYLSSISDKEDRKPVLYIANYQSIRDLQIIELNKITLLFGPNSSGKSAILDAIDDITKLLGRMKSKERNDFEKNLIESRMNWSARDNDKESLVIGFGGIDIGNLASDSDPSGSLYFYDELYRRMPGDGEARDIVFILGGNGPYYSLWKGGELLFQYHVEFLFYGDNDFKNFILENDDNSKEVHLESAKSDFRFDPKNPHRLPLNYCTDKVDSHVDNIERFVPKPPLKLNGKITFATYDIRNISDTHQISSNLGKAISFFLNNQPEYFCDELKKLSRLGPLRTIPNENELTFEFKGRHMLPKILEGHISQDLDSQSGMRYWKSLANHINMQLMHPSLKGTLNARTERLDRVNSWLNGEQRFNTRFSITYQHKAILPIPLPKQTDDIDWKKELRLISLSLMSGNDHIGLEDVGTGISQLIPVLVACELPLPMVVEQPELHLHPAHQLLIGDLLISRSNRITKNATWGGNWTLVETHSEHLILRILRRIRESSSAETKHKDYYITKDDVSVYYVNPTDDGAIIEHLRIDKDGDFIDEWPKGFFDERDEELFF